MSVSTKIYGLQAMSPTEFGNNSLYASLDKKRMFIIDNSIAFAPTFISDGVVSGLTVSDTSIGSNLSIGVSSGQALISGYSAALFGSLNQNLDDNSSCYLYLQRQLGFLGKTGSISNIVSTVYSDSTPPSAPIGLAISSFTYNSINLHWTNNTEPDLSSYLIFRSTDNITYINIATVATNSFTDSVAQNTLYYYKIKATDLNGNASVFSSAVSQTTALDLTPPSPVQYLLAFPLNSSMQLVWSAPLSGTFDHYYVTYQALDNSYNPTGPVFSQTLSSSTNLLLINSLANGQKYNFTIYVVSVNSIQSSPISTVSFPYEVVGPNQISTLTATNSQSTTDPNAIQLNISWTEFENPYDIATSYQVTLIENGVTFSNPISTTNTSISLTSFANATYGTIQQVLPRTQYIIEVLAVDLNNNKSLPKVFFITTNNFSSPAQINALVANFNDSNNLIFSWNNSTSSFANNYISLTIQDLNTFVTTTLFSNQIYAQNTNYVIPQNSIVYNSQYFFSIYCKDEFNNQSPSNSVSINISPSPVTIPGQVNTLIITSNDGSAFLEWKTIPLAEYYYIWRSSDNGNTFSLIEQVPATQISYYDYIQDNKVYFYFVTYENIYGIKSKNPIDDNFINYSYTGTYSATDASFPPTNNLEINTSGYNTLLSWDLTSGPFDGYEILRSFNNKYSFELVGYTDKFTTSFTDTNALIQNGTYYYFVRKYRNELRLTLTSSLNPQPIDSILLAKIVTSGTVSIEDLSTQIANLAYEINAYADLQFSLYKNDLTAYYDHRIDLSENITVSDWITSDNVNFTTQQYIIGSTGYRVFLDNIPYYGLYQINQQTGTLTFPSPTSVNVLSVICVGLNEIKNNLETGRISSFFASQVFDGVFDNSSLPTLDHEGRIDESAIPLTWRMESINGFRFTIQKNDISTNQELIGTALTFYDIIQVNNSLVAGTSLGFVQSLDNGVTWNTLISTVYPVSVIKFLHNRNVYIAISGNLALISNDGFGWTETFGLDNVNIIRDITEDSNGVIYISTDLGPYILDNTSYGNSLLWQNSPLNIASSTDCFAIYNDSGTIYASATNGLYSFNGTSWNLTTEMLEFTPVYQIAYHSGYIFAVKDNSVWRKSSYSSSFTKIADINVETSRKIQIFNNQIFITTSNGFYFSQDSNILTDTNINFTQYQVINYEKDFPDPTLLKVINNTLYLGSDKKLFTTTDIVHYSTIYDQLTGTAPTLYKNNERIRLGYFYNSNYLFTDTVVNTSDTVLFVANTYSSFRLQNQGWIAKNYSSAVNFYKNGIILPSNYSPTVPLGALNAIAFPTPTEFNSNSSTASIQITAFNTELTRLNNIEAGDTTLLNTNETIQDIVYNVVSLFYSVYSQFLGDILFSVPVTINNEDIDIIGNEKVLVNSVNQLFANNVIETYIPPFFNTIDLEVGASTLVDPVTGLIDFNIITSIGAIPDTSIDKYDTITATILSQDISDVGINTHKQLEDIFESVNTGLSYGLSTVLTGNLMKAGIFIKQRFSK